MTLLQAIARVATRLNKGGSSGTVTDTLVKSRIKNYINDVCQEKWHAYPWSFRYKEYPIVLNPVVNSGTLTATNGSRAITASGTPFDSSIHVGAWLRFTGDTGPDWYRIQTVNSTSTATIEPAYQGTTGGSKAYELYKTDFLLPTELNDVAMAYIGGYTAQIPVSHQLQSAMHMYSTILTGWPTNVTIFNQSQVETTYATGTLSGTINTTTLTGSGTAWLSNVKEGDAVVINGGTETYTVYKVNSDTSLDLYQKITAAASGVSYSISRQFGKILRVNSVPETARVMFIKGLRNYNTLYNDSDTNELLARFPFAVIEGAVWREASSSPDPREDSLYQKSEIMWANAMGEDEKMFPQSNRGPIWNTYSSSESY